MNKEFIEWCYSPLHHITPKGRYYYTKYRHEPIIFKMVN